MYLLLKGRQAVKNSSHTTAQGITIGPYYYLGEVEVESHPLDLSQHELLAQGQTLQFLLAAPLVNKCAAG